MGRRIMKDKTPPAKKQKHNLTIEFLNSETGRDFIAWWKNHRLSGYAIKGTQERWTILPYTASRCDRYMAEYCSDRGYGQELRFEYTAADYERWAQEQKIAEATTAELELRFGPMFWKTITPQEWIADVKTIVGEIIGDLAKANQAKIDEAYAHEPGQSEEETELLRRRRE